MKRTINRIIALAVGILLPIAIAVPAQAKGNLVPNGNFAELDGGSVTGFTLTGAAGLAIGAGPDGVNAIEIPGADATASVYVDGLTPHVTYGLTVNVKSDTDGAAAVTIAAMAGFQGEYEAIGNTYSTSSLAFYKHTAGTDTYVSSQGEWRSIRCNFTLPRSATAAKITLACGIAEKTVSYAELRVYQAANLISNGDFESLSVFDGYGSQFDNETGLALADTNGTPGNWRFTKKNAAENNMVRNPIASWGATHFTTDEKAAPSGYVYTDLGTSGYNISQVVPVKADCIYRLSIDWGVWHTDGAPVLQIWNPTTGQSYEKQWNYNASYPGYSADKRWLHTEYYFVASSEVTEDGMTEVCIFLNDNSGKGRAVADNVTLEEVGPKLTTLFSEGYETLTAMPKGGNTTVTVRNHYRVPKDDANDGTIKKYSAMTCLYKVQDGVTHLETIVCNTERLEESTVSDSMATIEQKIAVPAEEAGITYKIVSYTWDGLSPRSKPAVLLPAEASAEN